MSAILEGKELTIEETTVIETKVYNMDKVLADLQNVTADIARLTSIKVNLETILAAAVGEGFEVPQEAPKDNVVA